MIGYEPCWRVHYVDYPTSRGIFLCVFFLFYFRRAFSLSQEAAENRHLIVQAQFAEGQGEITIAC